MPALSTANLLLLSASIITWAGGYENAAEAAYQNVTDILQRHPSYSTFNRLLTEYGVAEQVNGRNTITVLCPRNEEMDKFVAGPAMAATKQQVYNVLSYHVLLDYEDPQKLRSLRGGSATITTLYQTTGLANGMQGFINVTLAPNGTALLRPASSPPSSPPSAAVISAVDLFPFNISFLSISTVLVPDGALTASSSLPPTPNITDILGRDASFRFSTFASLLESSFDVLRTFQNQASSSPGLTLFTPTNAAFDRFLHRFSNFPSQKIPLLLQYHAIASFFATPDQLLLSRSHGSIAGSDLPLSFSRPSPSSSSSNAISVNGIPINATIYSNSPLSIYAIDAVLLLPDMLVASPSPSNNVPEPAAETPSSVASVSPPLSVPGGVTPSAGLAVPSPSSSPSAGEAVISAPPAGSLEGDIGGASAPEGGSANGGAEVGRGMMLVVCAAMAPLILN